MLADNLGFDTVAEGVETEAQREVLERLGCELAQGHLFSQPVTRRGDRRAHRQRQPRSGPVRSR